MKWLKGMAVILFCVLAFAVYFLWPVVFPKDQNETLDITLVEDDSRRKFRIKRGYLRPDGVGLIQNLIVLDVGYPDMGLPPPWKQGEQWHRMQISIQTGAKRTTTGEYIVRRWQELGHLPNNGPGFDRYVGQRDGYDVYEKLPSAKSDYANRTLVFKDHDGTFVADDGTVNARMLGDLFITYASGSPSRGDPRQTRIWVENFIRQIVIPPLPPLDPASIKESLKG